MDDQELREALQCSAPDKYFELRSLYPLDLIEAEVALLSPTLQQRWQAFEQRLKDPRKRIKIDIFNEGTKEYIVAAPGCLLRTDGGVNSWCRQHYNCDVLVDVRSYPEAIP